MEIVFEPDLSNGLEASCLVKELLLIFNSIKTCSGHMEGNAFFNNMVYLSIFMTLKYKTLCFYLFKI